MNEQHPYCRKITPVAADVKRPLWSVMIPTFNCAEYLRKTLASVLAQDPGPDVMEIVVVDNNSTEDNPAAVVEELGRGRVQFHRQPENVGMHNNFQTCYQNSRGYLVHLLHGDDCVLPGFYEKMGKAFLEHPEIGAAFCRNEFIDEQDNLLRLSDLERSETGMLGDGWLTRIATICCIQPPAMVVRREVYEQLGGYDYRLRTAADWELCVRIAAHYPMWYETETLAQFRQHSKSTSKTNLLNGVLAEELYKAILMFESYLGNRVDQSVYATGKQNAAFLALQAADHWLNTGDASRAIALVQSALNYNRSFRVRRSAARIVLQTGTHLLLQTILGDDKQQWTTTDAIAFPDSSVTG